MRSEVSIGLVWKYCKVRMIKNNTLIQLALNENEDKNTCLADTRPVRCHFTHSVLLEPYTPQDMTLIMKNDPEHLFLIILVM